MLLEEVDAALIDVVHGPLVKTCGCPVYVKYSTDLPARLRASTEASAQAIGQDRSAVP
jgi:hypothetical protein